MITIAVVVEVVKIFVEGLSLHLTQRIRNGYNLVLGKLNGTGFMNVDMSRPHTDDTLVLIKHRVDGGSIGLCASCQEEYLSS